MDDLLWIFPPLSESQMKWTWVLAPAFDFLCDSGTWFFDSVSFPDKIWLWNCVSLDFSSCGSPFLQQLAFLLPFPTFSGFFPNLLVGYFELHLTCSQLFWEKWGWWRVAWALRTHNAFANARITEHLPFPFPLLPLLELPKNQHVFLPLVPLLPCLLSLLMPMISYNPQIGVQLNLGK